MLEGRYCLPEAVLAHRTDRLQAVRCSGLVARAHLQNMPSSDSSK